MQDDVIKWKHFPRCWPFTGEFPAQRPVTLSLDVFFYRRLDKRLSKQSWSWWFETSLWRHCDGLAKASDDFVRHYWLDSDTRLLIRNWGLCTPCNRQYEWSFWCTSPYTRAQIKINLIVLRPTCSFGRVAGSPVSMCATVSSARSIFK